MAAATLSMDGGNKEDQVTVITPEKLPAIHIAIPIEELDSTLEIVKDDEKPDPVAADDKDKNVLEEEEEICRFCHEDGLEEKLEEPCGCMGSVKFAHRTCVAHWCNTKRDTTCEICKHPYQPNYSVTAPPTYDDKEIYMSERGRIPLQLAAHRGINRLTRSMNVDFSLRNPTVGVLFGTSLLFFLGIMLLRDAYHSEPSKEYKITHILYLIMVLIATPICIVTLVRECRDQIARERNRQRVMQRVREIEAELPG